jgi:hypothetical protein
MTLRVAVAAAGRKWQVQLSGFLPTEIVWDVSEIERSKLPPNNKRNRRMPKLVIYSKHSLYWFASLFLPSCPAS